jgi:hypothetical protein
MQIRFIVRIALGAAFILLIPLVAMWFNDGVIWNLGDFVIAGVLLFVTGLALGLIAKKLTNPVNRVMTGAAIVAVLLIIWAELAVGILGTPFSGS